MLVSNKRNSKKRNIIIIIIFVLLLAATSFIIYKNISKNNTNNLINKPTDNKNKVIIDNNPATTEQITDGNNTKTKTSDESTKNTSGGDTSNSVNITITSTNQTNSILQVRTMIDAVDSSGLCTISLTSGSSTINKTASVQAQASISTCIGFDIPLSELFAGAWKITINYQGGNMSGSASKDIVIK